MKIYISTIPFSGMKIDGYLPLEALNARLAGGEDGTELRFLEAPTVDLTLTRTYGAVTVKGLVTGTCSQTCATCADPKPHEVTAELDWVLQSATEAAAGNGDLLDDPGVLVYEGDHIDLEDPIQEALILTLTPFWHPPRDAQETCTACGRDCSARALNRGEEPAPGPKGTNLGKLLEGAVKRGGKARS